VKLSDYEAAAKKFCAKPWDAIKKEFLKHASGSDSYAVHVCFAAAHVLGVLREGLHLNASSGVTLSNEVATPKGESFTNTWTLGALVVDVLRPGNPGSQGSPALEPGPRGAPRAARLLPSAPKTEGGAAALAGAFCVTLIALTAIMSKMSVGVAPGPPLEKVRSGTPETIEMAGLISVNASATGSSVANAAPPFGMSGGGGGAVPRQGAAGNAARVSVSSSRRRGEAP
jgi:hypothetical protein